MTRTFGIEFYAQAKKHDDKLPQDIKRRVIKALRALAHDPHPPQARRLAGSDYYRLRVGDYRVIYEVQEEKLLVLVIRIGRWKDVYRGLP